MLLKMGPWAEKDKEEKEDHSYHYPILPTRPARWHETWWAGIGFVLLVLGIILGMAFLLGWLMHRYP